MKMANKILGIFIIVATTIAVQAGSTTFNIAWTLGAWPREALGSGSPIVGDKLIFKFKAGMHNLIEVDKNGFDNCIAPPNAKVLTSGEEVITANAPGSRFFICGVGQHCKDGNMKFKMDVQNILRHIPPPSAPHSEFVVGDAKGWRENVDYKAWAKGKEFYMGDILVFNYIDGKHNVLKVDEHAFNKCIVPKDKNETLASGNDQITLMSMGNIGFISGMGKDCENGMKLLINVKCPRTRPKSPALHGGRKLVPSD
ncbi:hypothetical protein M8C21_027980 [Ambrosia artemisiifolia]|uniref:Phytocyanin domain-containing protein n=1 Tax=Ambrosia artemisiifolia TaxID=4212 RepID=A0AAD5GMD0_AMBAR|nr:hypothetical protein M8C21_027980 [Ambrosia artemisiifolia]